MTSMKHKSVDARRHSRSRLKRAVKPILERFGCTQMQVADRVTGVVYQNDMLKQKVEELEERCDAAETLNSNQKQMLEQLETEKVLLVAELHLLKEASGE